MCRELHLDNIVTRGNVYFQISFLQIKDIYIYILSVVFAFSFHTFYGVLRLGEF